MKDISKNDVIKKLEESIAKLENKEFNVYFFVVDTKNNPNGGVEYMYDIALTLHDMGYNVTMLHQEEEFIGPIEWLGERYSVLEHKSVENNNVAISASDFLFIPEVYVNVMTQTKNLPCKRIVLYQNPEYMMEFMPVGVTFANLNITDIITTNVHLENKLKSYFPKLKTGLVRPAVKKCFYTNDDPKKLIVNLITTEKTDLNNIIKPFFWKYPIYNWVSFRDMNGMSQSIFADVLREGAISVWVDDTTVNAQTALEALKSGNILIAKVPNNVPDWMLEDGELRHDIIWFSNFDDLHTILVSVIRGWTRNDIVNDFMEVHKSVTHIYSPEIQKYDIKTNIVERIFEGRINEYRQLLNGVKNNADKE